MVVKVLGGEANAMRFRRGIFGAIELAEESGGARGGGVGGGGGVAAAASVLEFFFVFDLHFDLGRLPSQQTTFYATANVKKKHRERRLI